MQPEVGRAMKVREVSFTDAKPMIGQQSRWLTAREAASYLKVEPRTLLLWARQGRIKGYVLSGTERITWRFRSEDLDATMTAPSVALTKGRIE
jgi:excisionase family DNA binding protein